MKYKYLLILNIFIIQNLSFANDNIDTLCKNFLKSSQNSDVHLNSNKDVLFKNGVLWKITTPNKITNYLFGTIHSQDYLVSKFPNEVELVLSKSKKLILEIIPDNKSNLIYKRFIYYNNGNQLDNLLEKPFFRELEEQVKYYDLDNIELNNLKYMKPWAAFSLIGRPKTIRAPSLESNLLKFAQERMIKIDSLETMYDITSSLDELSINDQINILKDTICNRKQIIKEIKKLVDLYINRDSAEIIKFTTNKNSDDKTYLRYMKKMLYDRNKNMLKKITYEFNSGDVFVAVGILHLIAEDGLLENLQDLGYTIEVIY
tara:strand:+ start:89 stop:1036 length:948 start_codon:yes stop_codon:yes gene_type:complete